MFIKYIKPRFLAERVVSIIIMIIIIIIISIFVKRRKVVSSQATSCEYLPAAVSSPMRRNSFQMC